jgi:hypothetical protein
MQKQVPIEDVKVGALVWCEGHLFTVRQNVDDVRNRRHVLVCDHAAREGEPVPPVGYRENMTIGRRYGLTVGVEVDMQNAITLTLPVSDDLCADIMCTALEGGIGYWCEARNIKREPQIDGIAQGYICFTAYDAEGSGAFAPRLVDYSTIREGIRRILCGAVKVRSDLRSQVLNAAINDDAGAVDCEGADVIVQAGTLNDITFG